MEADDEDAAWETGPESVEDLEPERSDCTMCEVADVQPAEGDAQ